LGNQTSVVQTHNRKLQQIAPISPFLRTTLNLGFAPQGILVLVCLCWPVMNVNDYIYMVVHSI
jgi:hypothetical protein